MSTSEIYGDPDSVLIPTPAEFRGSISSAGSRVGKDEGKISMLELARLTAAVGAGVLGRKPFGVAARVSEDRDHLVYNPQRRLAGLVKAARYRLTSSPKLKSEDGLARTFRHHVEKAGSA